ncbi:SUMF1/EgtB/PvdO family nonheme iron enzyme [uncultured Thiodictyon sp.]|uniref:formylglycine-generating enzyme family protein n=1 Tax=uncultured Thiodictyon sp. TaxID=1846217 RepID=UPI0025E634CA|nr:SUMF1/EgtB/PvdO family nonheme iron enzyme [uncultured Thiodictyon sp.]
MVTAAVGSFPPNPFGLYDTVGNVYEWVQDCWHDSYYGAPSDGSGWNSPCRYSNQIFRGGTWHYGGSTARASARSGDVPASKSPYVGLRLAQDR